MKKNQYYLIERNKRVDQVHIIPINNSLSSSLEEIDLYTTQYKNMEELLGGVNDCFIVNRDRFGLRIQEALFQDSLEVVDLANASLDKSLESENDKINNLLNTFCKKMGEDQQFYDKVIYEESPLYSKFVDYFSNKRFNNNYAAKYLDGCWVQKSYPLLRNIVWSLHHMKDYYNQNEERLLNQDELFKLMQKDVHPSQPPLFNFMDDNEFFQLLEKNDVEAEHGYQKCRGRRIN